MQPRWNQWRILSLLTGLLILKVNASVVLNYRNYFPPNFQTDFLLGRDAYFFGSYHWAFWVHLFAGPVSLVLGLLLINEKFLKNYRPWHRFLGRLQAINVLALLVPSGFWMSFYAASGTQAAFSFAILSLLTGTTIAMGWRAAVQRRYADHRRWMLRNFTLLCSAVILRICFGAATVLEYDPIWLDPTVTWGCWIVPLVILELSFRYGWFINTPRHRPAREPSSVHAASELEVPT